MNIYGFYRNSFEIRKIDFVVVVVEDFGRQPTRELAYVVTYAFSQLSRSLCTIRFWATKSFIYVQFTITHSTKSELDKTAFFYVLYKQIIRLEITSKSLQLKLRWTKNRTNKGGHHFIKFLVRNLSLKYTIIYIP